MSQPIRLFTSESVCAGHPDKICDAISDAILDEALRQDPLSRVAVETVAGANQVSLFGEMNSKAKINYQKIVFDTIKHLGYTEPKWGFSHKSKFSNFIHQQSPEIAQGTGDDSGAGDQGMMFGYARSDNKELMPMPIMLAHSLTKKIDEAREKGILKWLRPDGKAQVTVRYEGEKPAGVEKTVVAVAYDEQTKPAQVEQGIIDKIITPVFKRFGLSVEGDIIVNGTGAWHIPGPDSDAGLTGRKIVVDTYGGYARVGGGAFSGKDPSKVDRSGAYAARYIAKNIVAKGLADECEVGLAYVIGRPNPLMEEIECFGTEKVSKQEIVEYARGLLDTSVKGIVEGLNLRRPIYSRTSAYGHFGKSNLPWEQLAK